VAAALVLLAFAGAARAQVSPGPLSKAHAALDGSLNCSKCHAKAEGELERRCLACHGEIAWLIRNHRGYHAREGSDNCGTCHPEHGGADFKLIEWPGGSPEKFKHAQTGWALSGKHAAVACEKCHAGTHVGAEMRGLRKVRGNVAWTGLDTECRACHEDIHRGALGGDCARCHGEQGWRPVANFDHAKTTFPLTGLHAKVACAKCHEAAHLQLAKDANGKPKPLYKPLPHGECAACHADPHKGSLGAACSRCHVTASFKQVNTASFDHERTRYPLRGAHARLPCAKCHDEKTAWGKKPPYATCAGCHRDVHAGQAMIAGKAADCAACHSVESFKPSTFTVAQHARTKYPLESAHAAVSCRGCHGRTPPGDAAQAAALVGSAKIWFLPAAGRCVDCHRDPHAGRFSPGGERARAEECLACHTPAAWRPSTMDAAAHDRARFKLAGAHRAAPCFACHAEVTAAAPKEGRALPFAVAGQACRDCHENPHGAQFESRKDGGACEACHGVERFRPATGFDHDRVKNFRLEGAHAKVACAKCHPVVTTEGKRMTLYRPMSSKCQDCHATDGVLQR
jgi:hypothetical protein